jgi:hypothetical protein
VRALGEVVEQRTVIGKDIRAQGVVGELFPHARRDLWVQFDNEAPASLGEQIRLASW